jgi:uncharacterized protein
LLEGLPDLDAVALHHTRLNLGAPPDDDRDEVLAFTNAMIRRFGFAWVNEDLGLWSMNGKPLPYPLPPYLTDAGLETCVANSRFWQDNLAVPLLVEFPGFSEGISLRIGTWDAYDYFREVIVRSGSPCTLDIGHLISWRWMLGHRGEALYADLDRLPLEHCYEVHLSGCLVRGDQWIDAHHGILREEQLEMLARLLPMLPNLAAITYEDPKFDADGWLSQRAVEGFEALQSMARVPASNPSEPPTYCEFTTAPGDILPLHNTVYGLLHHADARTAFVRDGVSTCAADPEQQAALAELDLVELERAGRLVANQLKNRTYAGVGRLKQVFHTVDVDQHFDPFLASPEADLWREIGRGICVEEAFLRFCLRHQIGEGASLRAAFFVAMLKVLSTQPKPAFTLHPRIRKTKRGWVATSDDQIFALVDGKLTTGPVTPLISRLISGLMPSTHRERLVANALASRGLLATGTV